MYTPKDLLEKPSSKKHIQTDWHHFGRDKTLISIYEHFYWPQQKRYVNNYVKRCFVCQIAKGRTQNALLYTLLPIPISIWILSLDYQEPKEGLTLYLLW